MCGCLDKELTEFPLIKSRIYLCIMTTNARTRVAPKIMLSFLYIPGLYYIISLGLIWRERETQWEREREKAYLRHTQAHTQYAFECVIYLFCGICFLQRYRIPCYFCLGCGPYGKYWPISVQHWPVLSSISVLQTLKSSH